MLFRGVGGGSIASSMPKDFLKAKQFKKSKTAKSASFLLF